MAASRAFIGTSGWNYKHWVGAFYPEDCAQEKMLQFYADKFPAVEVNNTFYNVPAKKTLESWSDMVDEDFIFAVKASRYITHMKKLNDPVEALDRFFDPVRALGNRLGPILFQLPPNWHCNPGRLESFIASLPGNFRYVFEFRDPSWFDDNVYRILEDAGAAFCIYDMAEETSLRVVTSDFVYIRLHGAEKDYGGSYSTRELSGWAGAISEWLRQGKDVYFFFNNDEHARAPENAHSLLAMLR